MLKEYLCRTVLCKLAKSELPKNLIRAYLCRYKVIVCQKEKQRNGSCMTYMRVEVAFKFLAQQYCNWKLHVHMLLVYIYNTVYFTLMFIFCYIFPQTACFRIRKPITYNLSEMYFLLLWCRTLYLTLCKGCWPQEASRRYVFYNDFWKLVSRYRKLSFNLNI